MIADEKGDLSTDFQTFQMIADENSVFMRGRKKFYNTSPQLVADEKGVFGTVFQKFFIFYFLHKRTLRDLGSKKAPAKSTSAMYWMVCYNISDKIVVA